MKTNRMVRLPALVSMLISTLLAGCAKTDSSNINPTQIYTSYEASFKYDSPGSPPSLKLSATFNVAGSTGTYVALDGQSQVAVNGAALSEEMDDLFNTVSYSRNSTGATETDAGQAYTFVYTDNDGKRYQNVLNVPPAIALTNTDGATQSLQHTMTVGWSTTGDSAAVTSSDMLTAYVESTADGYAVVSSSSTGTGSSGQITIGTDSLNGMPTGPARLSLCRSRIGAPAQVPEVGGISTATRCTPKIGVTFN